jgi:hypothetical protein
MGCYRGIMGQLTEAEATVMVLMKVAAAVME